MTDLALSDSTFYARLGRYEAVVEHEPDEALRVDYKGRWCSLRLGDAFYRRLIDADVVVSRGRRGAVRTVGDPETIHERARRTARDFGARIRGSRRVLELTGSDRDRSRLLSYLDLAARWTPRRWARQRALFRETYAEPILILPPDRYRDVVVQPALGCPNGQCSFCTFYRDRPFRILAPGEFALHLGRVRELFGRTLSSRDGVSLGSANALAVPQKRLLEILRQVRETVGIGKRGLGAFWDPDHCPRRSVEDWRALRDDGMRIVLAGLETGSPGLRETLGKSADVARFISQIRVLRQSGMRLGVTVLVGPGGPPAVEEHRRDTTDVVRELELGGDDIVYLSPLQADDAMDQRGMNLAAAALRGSLREITQAKIVPYSMERFRYYA